MVIVTGAAGGVGSALSAQLVQSRTIVVLADHDRQGLDRLVGQLGAGASVLPIVTDLRDPSACHALIETAVSELGRIDALVNNAALLRSGPFGTFEVEDFDEMVAVNIRAPFLLCQSAFGWMENNGGGRIVNVASVGARDGGGALSVAAYTATKSAILGLTKALAKFGAPLGILVNSVLPGGIDSAMVAGDRSGGADRPRPEVPIGRLSSPVEIAKLIAWLCSPENTYCVGASIDINGGRYLS
ncbi:MAG TPA: SDR family NAD(P)-dependent oxidoreductase [Acidimicrobiales bacterium]|nr:SDR family NAD(P)-dependent oxidoreductase [Acidimicrobiales bacterium]